MINQPQHTVAAVSRGGTRRSDKLSMIGDEIWWVL